MHINFKKVRSAHYFLTTFLIFVLLYLYNISNLERSSSKRAYTNHFPTSTARNVAYNTSKEKDSVVKPTTDILYEAPAENGEDKHILIWTNPKTTPLVYLGNGNDVFIQRKCKFTNCFITNDRELLGHYSNFDAILFNGPELVSLIGRDDVPKIRSVRQKYVYVNIESAATYTICSTTWDNFFNWTWTYKLDSDLTWRYFVVKNASNHIIGPSVDINWIQEDAMEDIDDDLKAELAGMKKAVAWFVSNCKTESKREKYALQLQRCFDEFILDIDVFGDCGDLLCPRSEMVDCLKRLSSDYYFYLAFENALSEDYVTEKVLYAMQHNTVPVVYGGADYSRFLPPGSYLDLASLGAASVCEYIHQCVIHQDQYHHMFRWRRHYSYQRTDDHCRICEALNDPELVSQSTVYEHFSEWWSPKNSCGPIPPKPNIMTNRKVIMIP